MVVRRDIIHHELSRQLIGAFYETYDTLGFGFSEQVYTNSLAIALEARGILCQREVPIQVRFRGQVVGDFRADFIVHDKLIVECKSAAAVHPTHEKQLLNYLAASRFRVGYLLNFGPKAEFRRYVMSYHITRRRGAGVEIERTSGD